MTNYSLRARMMILSRANRTDRFVAPHFLRRASLSRPEASAGVMPGLVLLNPWQSPVNMA